ncbi:NAD(P)/FAD-dependent oxidoreductase [Streptomyces sp. NPDC001139]
MTFQPEAAPAPDSTVAFWWDDLGLPPRRRQLDGDIRADVCVVGAGYTGLWTAYHLARQASGLRVVVLEAEHVGYGASGRNGGWLTGALAGPRRRYATRGGRSAVLALQQAMHRSVDEVLETLTEESIDADTVKSGSIRVATTPAAEARLRAFVDNERAWGVTPDDLHLLSPGELDGRLHVNGARLAAFSPHCARLHPAKLVAGLANAAEQRGVTIYESTPATRITPGQVTTPYGTVTGNIVVRATEGFTGQLPGLRRHWLPMNSSMLVTDVIDHDDWDRIGWAGHETMSDYSHAYVYLQRTADNRIAIGGRGVPYSYAGRFDPHGSTPQQTVQALTHALHNLFPGLSHTPVTRSWSGVLAVPRDWCPGVVYDPQTGLAWAGGYVGQGVTAAHLAGRTLTDLILGRTTPITTLPWVNWHSPTWEPEPLRWLGVQGMYAAYRYADRTETRSRSAHTSPIARIADRISGR